MLSVINLQYISIDANIYTCIYLLQLTRTKFFVFNFKNLKSNMYIKPQSNVSTLTKNKKKKCVLLLKLTHAYSCFVSEEIES